MQPNKRYSKGPLNARPGKAFERGIAAALLMTALLAAITPRPAYAYIDPNTAGSLYQMLFPILVAVASALAVMRRMIVAYWLRLTRGCASVFRRLVRSGGGEPNS